jgi:transcriptional regulator with XRE-family HTH domain
MPERMDSLAITSELIRAARALLRWEQRDLAHASGVSLPTIKRLEVSPGPLAAYKSTVTALRRALEAAGVEFIHENGGGAGVRFRKPHRLSARAGHGIASEERFSRRFREQNEFIAHDQFLLKKNLAITAEQLRAARGLLGWSQSELAARAGLSLPTVRRVESESGPRVSDEARTRLREALESAGVGFTDENGGGVHLRKRRNTPK